MKTGVSRDLVAGLMFAAAGAFFLVVSRDYRMGTAMRMGPGYMPWWLGAILIGFGAVIAARGLLRGGDRIEVASLRPLALILVAIAAFGALIRPAGLIVAVAALVAIGGFAMQERPRAAQLVSTIVVLAAFSVLVFPIGLGLPIPILPRF